LGALLGDPGQEYRDFSGICKAVPGGGSAMLADADVELASIRAEHGFIGSIVPQTYGEIERA
jgi:hypothetical protein